MKNRLYLLNILPNDGPLLNWHLIPYTCFGLCNTEWIKGNGRIFLCIKNWRCTQCNCLLFSNKLMSLFSFILPNGNILEFSSCCSFKYSWIENIRNNLKDVAVFLIIKIFLDVHLNGSLVKIRLSSNKRNLWTVIILLVIISPHSWQIRIDVVHKFSPIWIGDK